jgi:DNA-binding transcriptional LysR family regulator
VRAFPPEVAGADGGVELLEEQREAPLVDLTVVNEPSWLEPLQAGKIDLASHVESSVHWRALWSDGFVCMVRKGHPILRARESLTLQHVVVAPSGSPGSLVDSELERRGKSRRVALRVPNFLVAPAVVSHSDFISTLPERLARQLAKLHPVQLLAAPIPLLRFTSSLAWHARVDNDPAHRWLRDVIVERLPVG